VLMAPPKEIFLSDRLRSDMNKVTLEVLPQDAETLSQAIEDSKIRLVLRNPACRVTLALPGADVRDLLPQDALHEEAPNEGAVAPLVPTPPPAASGDMPAPPPVPSFVQQPIQWMVDVFKGAVKESHVVETR
jgi:hypothetical protein